jgi:DNA-binding NtrC family response regulator
MKPARATGEVLIVDDEVLWRRQLEDELEEAGHHVTGVGALAEARRLLAELSFDWILLDVNLPDGSGLEFLRKEKVEASMGVIVMTAEGGVEAAVEAMRHGAVDFLPKPFEPEELPLVLARAFSQRRADRLQRHERSGPGKTTREFFFGPHHAPLRSRLEKILAADERLAARLPPLLLLGETGTGKSALARWIHAQGPRARGPFVEVNCAALPENLVEAELFGHEKGAFTDARTDRLGLFEAASGGTLFLDEVGSLTLSHQAKLLTAVEEFSIRRVGGRTARPVDCRLIAATLDDLPKAVKEGRFREDLFHRLSLLVLELPPLRSHPKAAPETAQFLLQGLLQRYRLPPVELDEEALKDIAAQPWAGNVRELSHELERALIYSPPGELCWTPRADRSGGGEAAGLRNPAWRLPEDGFALEEELSKLEQTLIEEALADAGGNVSAAARRLGVARDFLRYRVKSGGAD